MIDTIYPASRTVQASGFCTTSDWWCHVLDFAPKHSVRIANTCVVVFEDLLPSGIFREKNSAFVRMWYVKLHPQVQVLVDATIWTLLSRLEVFRTSTSSRYETASPALSTNDPGLTSMILLYEQRDSLGRSTNSNTMCVTFLSPSGFT